MTLYKFNALKFHNQAEAVWENGVFLADRSDTRFNYLLYQVDGFYVEVWYDSIKNEINKLRPFKNTSQLDPYLENMKVDLDGLAENQRITVWKMNS